MRLGLHFRIPDFWTILEEWPDSLITYWRAFYDLEPWDAPMLRVLGECKYKAPEYVDAGKPKVWRRMSGGII
jgi:hypothetical protein